MDDNNSRSLDTYEFNKAMKDYMLGFNDSELRTLFNYFDIDRSGTVDYDEFIRSIKGPMNQNRKNMLDKLIINWTKIRMDTFCLLYTSPSPRDQRGSRMPSSA